MLNTDFNLENDAKAPPLIPKGTYFGSIIEVEFDSENQMVATTVSLSANPDDVFCTDGETPVNGMHVSHKLWLPKATDRNEPSKNPAITKFQSKVNMLKEFVERMELEINTAKDLSRDLQNKSWIGKFVGVGVSVSNYKGRPYNQVDFMGVVDQEQAETKDIV